VQPLHEAPELAGHAVHVPPLGPYNPELQMHLVNAEQPLHEAPVLTGHATHVVATVAAVVVEYVLAEQLVHSTLPVVLLNFPATHATHGPPLGPVNPTLHVQFVDTVQPLHEAPELAGQALHATVRQVVFEKVPAVQAVHAALPVAVLKVPATQGVHVPPLGPVYPMLQVQEVTAGLEMGELVFAGHDKQVVRFDAPTVVEYFPTGHAKQVVAIVAAVVFKYVPAAQLVHATLPVAVL